MLKFYFPLTFVCLSISPIYADQVLESEAEQHFESHEEGATPLKELDDEAYTDNLEVDPPLDHFVPPHLRLLSQMI